MHNCPVWGDCKNESSDVKTANQLAGKNDDTALTRRINCGLIGFDDRRCKLLQASFFVMG